MKNYQTEKMSHKNAGIAREWALCRHFGIERVAHDHSRYDEDSDLNLGSKHISIKASAFTLMSGSLCEGRDTFDGIWELYAERVHSNTFVYMTTEFVAYEMNINEFKSFVYEFGRLERESAKNGGCVKIRFAKETKRVLEWLTERVAA